MDKITPCLWADGNAEEMAAFYVSIVPDSHVVAVTRSPADNPGNKEGEILLIELILAGRTFTILNGGPQFKFTEALSLQVLCEDQSEVDRLWSALSAHPESEICGWLKDRFGLSWQIVPKVLLNMISDPDRAAAKRAMQAMMSMSKLDIASLESAFKAT